LRKISKDMTMFWDTDEIARSLGCGEQNSNI